MFECGTLARIQTWRPPKTLLMLAVYQAPPGIAIDLL